MPPIEQSNTCTDWAKTHRIGLRACRIIAPQSLLKERDCGVEVHDTMHILQVTEDFRHGNKAIVFAEKNYRQSAPRLLRLSVLDHTDI